MSHVCLHTSMYACASIHVCVYVHDYVFYVQKEARDQQQIFSSIILHFMFWNSVSDRNWWSWILPAYPNDSTVSTSPELRLQGCSAAPGFLCEYWGSELMNLCLYRKQLFWDIFQELNPFLAFKSWWKDIDLKKQKTKKQDRGHWHTTQTG